MSRASDPPSPPRAGPTGRPADSVPAATLRGSALSRLLAICWRSRALCFQVILCQVGLLGLGLAGLGAGGGVAPDAAGVALAQRLRSFRCDGVRATDLPRELARH